MNFHTTGEFLTKHFRNLVLEDRWAFSLNCVSEALPGITLDQVVSLLSGNSKLTGSTKNGGQVDFIDDDDWDYKASLKWKFSGTYSDIYGNCFKAYGYIRSVRWTDAEWAFAQSNLNVVKKEHIGTDFFTKRCTYYMKDPNDIQINCPKGALHHFLEDSYPRIFLQKTLQPPFWIETHKCLDKAIIELLEYRDIQDLNRDYGDTRTCLDQTIKEGENTAIYPKDFFDAYDQLNEIHNDHEAEKIKREKPEVEIEEESFGDYDVEEYSRKREEEEKLDKERQEEFEKHIEWVRKEVIETANSYFYGEKGWMDLKISDERTIKVPRPPFEQWVFSGVRDYKLAVPWKPIAYSGMKLYNDDPNHTDWILGAGLPIDCMYNTYSNDRYDKEMADAAYNLKYEMLTEALNFDFLPLSGEGNFSGNCWSPTQSKAEYQKGDILILPSLDATYYKLAMEMDENSVILAQNGGELSHLVIANKKNFKIGVVKDLLYKCGNGSYITVGFDKGNFSIEKQIVAIFDD